jgi:hypothetical protein
MEGEKDKPPSRANFWIPLAVCIAGILALLGWIFHIPW